MASNVVVPMALFTRDEHTGERLKPKYGQQILISHPEDCQRLARKHVVKQPNFTGPLFGSLLSTTDERNWRHQRESFNLAFLPHASLAKVFPISVGRAAACTARLMAAGAGGNKPVEMNEFFLHETQAQLQLAMFGESEEFMNETNCPFRKRLAGEEDGNVGPFLKAVVERSFSEKHQAPTPGGDPVSDHASACGFCVA